MILDIFFILGILYIIREVRLIYVNGFNRKPDDEVDLSKVADDYWGDPSGSIKEMFSIDLSRIGIMQKLCVGWIICGIFFTDESQLFKYLLYSNCTFSILLYLSSTIDVVNVFLRGQEQNKKQSNRDSKYWNIISRSVKILLIVWILYTHFISYIVYA